MRPRLLPASTLARFHAALARTGPGDGSITAAAIDDVVDVVVSARRLLPIR